MHFLVLGFIKGNSTITLKREDLITRHEDGTNVKLKWLKTPISLDDLEIEMENNTEFKKDIRIGATTGFPFRNMGYDKYIQPLDVNIDSEKRVIKINLPLSMNNSKKASTDTDKKKNSAAVIFENSRVYPFVYSYNKYKCYVCDTTFLASEELEKHSLNEHRHDDLKAALDKDSRSHLKVDVTNLQCKICSTTHHNLDELVDHLGTHGTEIDSCYKTFLIPFKLNEEPFVCQECGEVFKKLRKLFIHMSKHFGNFSCEICGSVFMCSRQFRSHKQIHLSGSYPCTKCDKIFNNPIKRSMHIKGVHKKNLVRTCPMPSCPERFSSDYMRTKHLKHVHNHNVEMFKCKTCDREFYLKFFLDIHVRQVHLQERNFHCTTCDARFFTKQYLTDHMVTHTGEKKFRCDVCGKDFARRKRMNAHRRSHGVGYFKCQDCKKVFSDQETLAAHAWITTASSGPRTSIWQMTISERQNAATMIEHTSVRPFFYQQANFKCFYCDQIFPEVNSLLQHTALHITPERSALLMKHLRKGKRIIKVDISALKCKICEQRYSDLDDVRKHLTSAHKKEFNASGNGLMAYNLCSNSGMLSCHKCNKTFNSFFLLNRHMNAHFSVVCETCGLGFMSHQRLISHRIVHQNGVHKCDKCNDVFQTKLKLRYHMFKRHEHTNAKKIKPLKCPHCLERFSEHYKKMSHLKDVHGISFTFDCQACKSVFPTRRALTEHTTKLHTQKIRCKICGKCFGTQSLLKMHLRGHTGERNFFCNVCQKSYMHERTLRQHMRIHGPSWKFTCSECGSGFHARNDFNKHIKQWHPQWQFKTIVKNFESHVMGV